MIITVSFDPELDRPQAVAQRLAWSFGFDTAEELLTADDTPPTEEEDEDPTDLEGWTAAKMSRYVLKLKPTARKVLRAIAQGAPEIGVDSVQDATGLDDPAAFAGSMSSFGFAVNNTRGVRSKPFSKQGQLYSMTVPLADLALDVLDEAGL